MTTIPVPSRTGRFGAALVLVSLILCGTFGAIGPSLRLPTLIGSAAVLMVAVVLGEMPAVHLSLVPLLVCLWGTVWPATWPLFLVGPWGLYCVLAATVPSLRRTCGLWHMGVLNRTVWFLAAVTLVLSSAALVVWYVVTRPNISLWAASVPNWPAPLLVLVGLGFSLVNAIIEEGLYRGVILQSLDAAFGAGWLAILLQAIPFGIGHLNGVPNGWLGAVMAGVYGVALGVVRRYSGGLVVPVITHIAADLVIFCLLVASRY